MSVACNPTKLLALLPCLCYLFLFAIGPCRAQAHNICEQAHILYDSGRFEEAARSFASCLVINPVNQDALLFKARSLFRTYDFAGAEAAALSYTRQHPGSAACMYLLGQILEQQNKPRQSLEWFTRAASLATPTAEDLHTVGLDYVLLDDYPDAVHWLTRAVELDATHAGAWYDLGRAHMMLQNFPAAEKALRQSLRWEPRSIKAENNLGVTLEAENRIPEALDTYRTAVAWQSDRGDRSEQPLLNYGALLITQQRAAEALPLLQQAVAISPGDARAREQLARAYDQTGSLDAAISEMKQATTLDTTNARFHFELGQMYRRSGNEELSKQELKQSAELYGSHPSKTLQ